MRFRIKRASDYHGDRCPFPGAEFVEGSRVREYRRLDGSTGTETVPDNRWEIEVNTFEELMNMADETGIILEKDKIIIYDDYYES